MSPSVRDRLNERRVLPFTSTSTPCDGFFFVLESLIFGIKPQFCVLRSVFDRGEIRCLNYSDTAKHWSVFDEVLDFWGGDWSRSSCSSLLPAKHFEPYLLGTGLLLV